MSTLFKPGDGEPHLELRAVSELDPDLLALRLNAALRSCRCLLLEHAACENTHLALRFRVALRQAFDLYSILLALDLSLTAESHEQLTGLCTLKSHLKEHGITRTAQAHLVIQTCDEMCAPLTAAGFA